LVDTDSNLGSGDGSGRLPVRRKNPKGEKW
jgi:hypothetical protein